MSLRTQRIRLVTFVLWTKELQILNETLNECLLKSVKANLKCELHFTSIRTQK